MGVQCILQAKVKARHERRVRGAPAKRTKGPARVVAAPRVRFRAGMEIEHRPIGKPHFSGHIERALRKWPKSCLAPASQFPRRGRRSLPSGAEEIGIWHEATQNPN
jgi:hypothetical protein